MMLRRSESAEQALQQFISRQYDPRSPDFHQLAYATAIRRASSGLRARTSARSPSGSRSMDSRLNSVPAGGLFVDFSGTAGQVAQAFHTEIHRYRVNGQDHYANASDPYIPSALAPVVSGFRALNDFHPQPQVHHLGVAHLDRTTGKMVAIKRGGLASDLGCKRPLYRRPPGFREDLWSQPGLEGAGRCKVRAPLSSVPGRPLAW